MSLIRLWQVLFGLKNQKSGNVSKSESSSFHILEILLHVFSVISPLCAAMCAGYAFAVVAQKIVIFYCSKNEKQF